ncbi:SDR family NAD(P)-dependent oxidoreductase [Nonomuraea sp. NPDC050556]|uniref:SDR family NAD(P)-dependent oxidoreductase n=1 Tax=Nonomuraea sp. NPDC050556 TaxID=3364369 RepID=UPI0037BA54FC
MERVALVTGSTRGLGSAIAHRLAADGMRVARNGLDGSADDVYYADVTSADEVADLVARIGRIDVLVLNATGPQPEAPILEAGWQDHLDQLDFFVRSPLLLGKAVIPGMIERGFGRIVHIDSEVADRPPVGRSAYATAKNAQIGLARAWAHELAPHGITVNTVAPGFIPVERHADVPEADRTAYLATVPAGRFGDPDDVAHAVSFLASDGAGFITGQRILVDGGRSTYV